MRSVLTWYRFCAISEGISLSCHTILSIGATRIQDPGSRYPATLSAIPAQWRDWYQDDHNTGLLRLPARPGDKHSIQFITGCIGFTTECNGQRLSERKKNMFTSQLLNLYDTDTYRFASSASGFFQYLFVSLLMKISYKETSKLESLRSSGLIKKSIMNYFLFNLQV